MGLTPSHDATDCLLAGRLPFSARPKANSSCARSWLEQNNRKTARVEWGSILPCWWVVISTTQWSALASKISTWFNREDALAPQIPRNGRLWLISPKSGKRVAKRCLSGYSPH
jgi:hypothetical protein